MPLAEPPEILLTLEGPKSKPPDTRLNDATKARELVTKLIREDETRSRFRAICQGNIDGNSPYNEAVRRQNGQSWMTNLNFGEAEAIIESALTPNYALFSGVDTYTKFKTNYRPEDPDNQLWNDKVGYRWTCLLNRWTGFDWNIQQCFREETTWGYGPLMFEKDNDWRFRSIPSRNILVPKDAASTVDDKLPFIVIRVPYQAHELYDFIQGEAAAKAVGWNVEAVQWAIKNAVHTGAGVERGQRPWEYYQQLFKNHDIATSYNDSDIIETAHIFVQEFPKGGKKRVSHFIVTEAEMSGFKPLDKDNDRGSFLFKHPNRYKSYDEALIVFFSNLGTNGKWHSVRGLAQKSFKHVEVSNRLKGRVIDGVFINSSLVLQPQNANDKDKLQVMQVGAVTMIPPNCTVVSGKLNTDINGVLAVDRMVTNHLSNNIGSYNQRTLTREDGRGEQPTATQIQQQVQKESSLNQGSITRKYVTLDRLYLQMYERVMKSDDEEAVRFREECEADGVPPEAMRDMEYVRANRQSGYGSPALRQLVMKDLFQTLMPALPENGKDGMINEYISGAVGPDKVQIFNPSQEKPDIDEAMATLENGTIRQGVLPVVISGMNNVVHLKVHMEDTVTQMEPLKELLDQQQLDPQSLQQGYEYLSVMVPHMEEHLGRLRGDPTRKGPYDTFVAQLRALTSFHGKLRGAVRDAQRAAQQAALEEENANALGVETRAKLEATQADIQRKDLKAATDIERKNLTTQTSEERKNWVAQQDNVRKNVTTATSIANEKAKRTNGGKPAKSNGR